MEFVKRPSEKKTLVATTFQAAVGMAAFVDDSRKQVWSAPPIQVSVRLFPESKALVFVAGNGGGTKWNAFVIVTVCWSGFRTVKFTSPVLCAGVVAVICVELFTTVDAALVLPN